MVSERRKHLRVRVDIPATEVWGQGLERVSALILDQSQNGVQVRLDVDERIASECYILFRHRMEPCRLVWQASRSAGLVFRDAS